MTTGSRGSSILGGILLIAILSSAATVLQPAPSDYNFDQLAATSLTANGTLSSSDSKSTTINDNIPSQRIVDFRDQIYNVYYACFQTTSDKSNISVLTQTCQPGFSYIISESKSSVEVVPDPYREGAACPSNTPLRKGACSNPYIRDPKISCWLGAPKPGEVYYILGDEKEQFAGSCQSGKPLDVAGNRLTGFQKTLEAAPPERQQEILNTAGIDPAAQSTLMDSFNKIETAEQQIEETKTKIQTLSTCPEYACGADKERLALQLKDQQAELDILKNDQVRLLAGEAPTDDSSATKPASSYIPDIVRGEQTFTGPDFSMTDDGESTSDTAQTRLIPVPKTAEIKAGMIDIEKTQEAIDAMDNTDPDKTSAQRVLDEYKKSLGTITGGSSQSSTAESALSQSYQNLLRARGVEPVLASEPSSTDTQSENQTNPVSVGTASIESPTFMDRFYAGKLFADATGGGVLDTPIANSETGLLIRGSELEGWVEVTTSGVEREVYAPTLASTLEPDQEIYFKGDEVTFDDETFRIETGTSDTTYRDVAYSLANPIEMRLANATDELREGLTAMQGGSAQVESGAQVQPPTFTEWAVNQVKSGYDTVSSWFAPSTEIGDVSGLTNSAQIESIRKTADGSYQVSYNESQLFGPGIVRFATISEKALQDAGINVGNDRRVVATSVILTKPSESVLTAASELSKSIAIAEAGSSIDWGKVHSQGSSYRPASLAQALTDTLQNAAEATQEFGDRLVTLSKEILPDFSAPPTPVAVSNDSQDIASLVRSSLESQDRAGFGEPVVFTPSAYTPSGIYDAPTTPSSLYEGPEVDASAQAHIKQLQETRDLLGTASNNPTTQARFEELVTSFTDPDDVTNIYLDKATLSPETSAALAQAKQEVVDAYEEYVKQAAAPIKTSDLIPGGAPTTVVERQELPPLTSAPGQSLVYNSYSQAPSNWTVERVQLVNLPLTKPPASSPTYIPSIVGVAPTSPPPAPISVIPSEFAAAQALPSTATDQQVLGVLGDYQERKVLVSEYFADELPNYSGTYEQNTQLAELSRQYSVVTPLTNLSPTPQTVPIAPSVVRPSPTPITSVVPQGVITAAQTYTGNSILDFCKKAGGISCSSRGADRLRLYEIAGLPNQPTGDNNRETLRRLREYYGN